MPTYRLGELFCGPGGIALGAKNAIVNSNNDLFRIEHAWANDYDIDTCKTYVQNICPGSPESVVCEDVRTLDINSLKNISPIEGFAFGFPCNDFSIVGEQKGLDGGYGPLYTYGITVINTFNPMWFVAENVSGLQSSNEGNAFKQILQALQEAGRGYQITAHHYYFEDYGVPQNRHRIIIVGMRTDLNLKFMVPAPTHKKNHVPVSEALANIPHNAKNQELTTQSQTVIERLKHIKPGQNVWNANLPSHLQLNVKGAKLSQIYRRLEPNKPSYTITGSGGGGTHVYHWQENRALTNRERARIQTFPDNYEFIGSKESVRRQIGMAVPPMGAQIIFEAILKTLAGVEYDYIQPNIKMDEVQTAINHAS
jgi:DNA (cytosine-5)-methyltransferase 1